jgi:hypothetical protein
MMLRAATYGADRKPAGDVLVAPRVCDCCPTAAAVTAEGPIVAFRNRTKDEIRDIYVTRFAGGRWSDPVPVHRDGWKILGCPVNGPALSAQGRTVLAAWFTAKGESGQALAAFSSDAGRTFAPPIRIDDNGAAGRVQTALLPDGSAYVAWVAQEHSALRLRAISRAGRQGESVLVAEGLGRHYPRMALHGNELLVAWVENTRGSSRVRAARLKVG